MTNKERAAYHLNIAAQATMFENTSRMLRIPRNEKDIERIRWHLFQARFARLQDVMPVGKAFPDAVIWAAG